MSSYKTSDKISRKLDYLETECFSFPNNTEKLARIEETIDYYKLKSVNLQNFPRHGAGYEVRNIITAPENHVIVSLDYAQLEARLLAMASKDEVFCKAIWDGEDTHMRWAERILEDYPDLLEKYNITKKEFRSDVKTNLVFASFYGSSRDSVAYHYQTNYGISQNITFNTLS